MTIAVIGAGIAGLASAHYLDEDHDVTLFEARSYAGGHTNTVEFEWNGETVSVDTGFIVYNDRTYPNFIRLLDELGIRSEPTTMSFSVHDQRNGFEYAGHSLNGLLADRSNVLNGSFYRMLYDIVRFNRKAPAVLDRDRAPETLGEFLRREGFSAVFVEEYLVPMAAAIWSSPRSTIREFPLKTFVEFFRNHGLLQIVDRPTWRIIENGSRKYVQRLLERFSGRVHLDTPVDEVSRSDDGVRCRAGGATHRFDAVVLAVHSDQALAMIDRPTDDEQTVLGAIDYHQNDAVLHTDSSVLPENRRAWSAWNARLTGDASQPVSVSYNMNILQHISKPDPLCVSLNMSERIDSRSIIDRFEYDHPVYTPESDRARARHHEINGARNTYFAGAYWGNGFHEDGVNSALDVVDALRTVA